MQRLTQRAFKLNSVIYSLGQRRRQRKDIHLSKSHTTIRSQLDLKEKERQVKIELQLLI
jgi:hypothetical protein